MPEGRKIDTLIINVAECEPYITADHREALENSWDVLSGIYLVKDLLNIDRTLIAVEKNKPDVIKVLSEIAYSDTRDPENKVRVLPLKARYPRARKRFWFRPAPADDRPRQAAQRRRLSGNERHLHRLFVKISQNRDALGLQAHYG